MRYTENSQLPKSIRRQLPDHAQAVWRESFNSAIKGNGGSESSAAAAGWGAVKRQYEKSGDGRWVRQGKARMKPTMHSEAFDLSGGRADRENRIIHDVAVMGRKSRNGYDLTEGFLREVTERAEGTLLYINHQIGKKTPDVRDLGGHFSNARFETSLPVPVRADLHLRPGANGDMILDDAEKLPKGTGFSLHHESFDRRVSGRVEVHKLHKLHSIDYVAGPATTDGMFEATQNNEEQEGDEMKPEEVTLEWLRTNRPEVYTEAVEAGKNDADATTKIAALEKHNVELQTNLATHVEAETTAKRATLVESVLENSGLNDATKKTFKPVLEKAAENGDDEAALKALCESVKASAATMSQERGDDKPTTDDLKKAIHK